MVKKVGGGTPHKAEHKKAKTAELTSVAAKAQVTNQIAARIFGSVQKTTEHLDSKRFSRKS